MRKINKISLFLLVLILLAGQGYALQVGDPAPDFTLMDIDGFEYTLSDHAGKVVFLNFMGCT